jgi:hypothetical protein
LAALASLLETAVPTYRPGLRVPTSGIYKVVHDGVHRGIEHEVTCVAGEPFPPCNHCGSHPRFSLVRAARHLSEDHYFRR